MDSDPLSVVEAYLAARNAFDFERARTFLADRDFSFESPVRRFRSADDYIQHASLTGGIVQSVETRKVFVDGEDVCHFQTFRIQISEKLAVKVVQWARVREGRIDRLELLYDASAYRDLFPAES